MELRSITLQKGAEGTGAIKVHSRIEQWLYEAFRVEVHRCTALTAWEAGGPRATTVEGQSLGKAWARTMGERMVQEQYCWEEWRSTRSYVA